ncbi:MAG: TonB-dependent receptor [Flavobacteriales bacterium]
MTTAPSQTCWCSISTNNTWAIRANVGTAFRSPNVDDIGKIFDSEPGALTVPNPDLKAEYATNFDLGIAKVFSEKVKIDLAGYYTIWKMHWYDATTL